MAASGKAFRVARGGTRLTNLIQVGHEAEDSLILAALIDKRFATTERGAGFTQEIQDESLGLFGMDFPVGLFFSPTSASNEEQIGVRTNGLGIGFRSADSCDRSAFGFWRKRDGELLQGDGRGCGMPGFMTSGIEQENPWTSFALKDAFDALAIEPASGGYGAIGDIYRCDVGIHLGGQTVSEARKRAEEARGSRSDHQLRSGGTAKGFGGRGVAGESWFGKIVALDAENAGGAGGGEGIRGRLNVLTDEADF